MATSALASIRRLLRRFPQRYAIVLLTFLCTSICYVERVGFSVAYTAAAATSNVDQATKGWIMSAFYYGYATSQIPGSWAAQRLGGRRILTFSFIAWSLLCALTPTDVASATVSLVAVRLLIGVAQGLIFPAIHTVLAQWVPPHEKSRSVSLTTSGMYFGASLAMVALPSLVATQGPSGVFFLVASLGTAWSLLWARLATDPPGSFLALTPLSPKMGKREEGGPVMGASVSLGGGVFSSSSSSSSSSSPPACQSPP